MLSEEQKQELDIRLEQTWTGSRACPICGRENWNRLDMVFEEKAKETLEDEHGAPSLPLLHLSCYTCGYVISFNAITLKLIHPLLQMTDGETEETSRIEHISDILKLEGTAQQRPETAFPDPSKPARTHSKHDAHILGMHVDSLMNQSVNFMILGGLVSLIALTNQGNAFLYIYLSKIVWYFLAAIFVYYLTSTREYARDLSNLLGIHKKVAQSHGRSEIEAPNEQPEAKHEPNVGRTLKLLAANKILVMLFIISFIVHFYIFIFSYTPLNLREEILGNIALIALGLAAYIYTLSKTSFKA